MSLSEIRVNTTKTRTGVGTITYTETGPVITGIATASNFKTGSTNVHSTGVEVANINTGGSTATFGGAISGTSATLSGALSGTTASFSGTVSIGGTLTYEDVTNIDAVGIITARSTVSIGDSINHIGDTDTAIRFPSANTITAETSGSERLRIHSNGAISAGVDNDSYEFTLQGKTGGAPTLWLRDGTTTGNPRIIFGDTGAALRSAIYHKNSNDSLNFYTNGEASDGDEKLRITSGGDLHVKGASSPEILNIPTDATPAYFVGDSNRTGAGQHLAEFKGRWNGNDVARIVFLAGADTSNKDDGDIRIDTTPSGGSSTERLRITSTGRVLIGNGSTYSPSGDLHIVGDTNSNGPELYLQVNNNNTTDNIGALWFGNNVDKSLVKLAGHTHTANNTADFTVSTSAAGTLGERLRITSDGKVCINNDTALSDLHICTAGSSEQDGTLRIGGTNSELGLVLDYDQASATVSRITANPTYNNNSSLLKICVDGDANPNQLVLMGSGKIGIGIVDNTSATLQVRDGSSGSGTIRLGGSNSNGIGMDMTYSNSGNTSTVFKQNYRATNAGALMKFDSGYFAFHTGTAGTEHLRINSLGVLQLQQSTNTNQGIEWYSAGGSKSASIGWGNGNANFEFKNFRQDSQSTGPYGNIDFFTGSSSSPPLVMRMQVTGEVGIGTDNPLAKFHVKGGENNVSAKFDNHIRIDSHTDGTNLVKGNGVTYVSGTGGASDGNWKDIFTNWRYSAGSFVAAIGDTTVKTMISGHFYVTAPNYGVVVWNEITNNNSWNSGAADMQIVTHNTSNYKLQIKHTSYYNTSNNFAYYIMFNFCV